jgi:hypothetical protein
MAEFKPCASCEKPREAVNDDSTCPLRMSDGRSFGDFVYGSRCEKQYQLQFDKGIESSYDYKQYLMQNAESLMHQNAQRAFTSTSGN